jgi:hypothetical protein
MTLIEIGLADTKFLVAVYIVVMTFTLCCMVYEWWRDR